MHIIQIEDFFHPNAGYQVNILSKYFVKQGHDVTVVTGELEKIPDSLTGFFGKDNIKQYDEVYTKKYGVKIIRIPIISYISGRCLFSRSLETTVEELNPDILFVHGVDTLVGIKYVFKVAKLRYPLVCDSHMLEMASINPFNKQYRWFYRTFITPRIIEHRVKIIRVQDDNYIEKCLGIPLSQSPFISVGSDTMLFYPDSEVKVTFRRKHNISEDDFVVVYTGKLDDAKGGRLLAEAFRKKIVNSKNRNVTLLVVGNANGQYGQEVEEVFNQSENNVIRFPTQKYLDLPQFYQAADLSVFPKQCSLSFYDAQACGLPVVSEDNSINIERLNYANGFNFKAESLESFRENIIKCIEMEPGKFERMGNNAYNFVVNNYNYEDIAKQYNIILIQEYNKFHSR